MNKKVLLVMALVIAISMLCSCAYLPLAGLTTRIPLGQNTQQIVADGDTVTISRELYERYQQFDELLMLMDIVDENYYIEVDPAAMLEGAAAGLLAGVDDPYTYYYTPEAFAEMWEDDEGEYAGIGIQISGSYATGLCTITSVFADSPAREAGMLKGDILYRVSDEEHEPMYVSATTLDAAVAIMRGVPGTPVTVTVLRGGEEVTFTLNRAVVNVTRVEACMLADEIGYIALYQFAGDCATKFAEAVDELVSQGAKGIIMDLRDNPGGWVKDSETIADIFLDAGIVCTSRYRDGEAVEYRTRNGKVDVDLVIMINENSASSSEILTGCLKDRANATVVGKQSYGKGIMQGVLPLDNGAGMQLTVCEYFTPNGNAVHKIGITPDVEIDLDEGDNGMHEFADLADAQLAKALEVMQEKLKK